jgi:hypothetical protein
VETIAQHQLAVAIITMIVIAIGVFFGMPTLLTYLREQRLSKNTNTLREMFDAAGYGFSMSVPTLLAKSRIKKEKHLRDALYILRQLGEIENSKGPDGEEIWRKKSPAPH